MRTITKLLSVVLSICMVISIAVVGVVPAAADTTSSSTDLAQETIQGSAVLHCFNWSYNNIKAALPDIAAAGYTAVQTSPVQRPKDYNSSWTDTGNQWWKLYQPLGLSIAADNTSWLGTKAQLTSLCAEAENYGIKVIVDIVANHLGNNGTDGGTYSYINSAVESDLKNANYYHSNNIRTNDDSRYNITQYHLGMPDLNTANSYVQQRALGLLEECIDCGVDGFRFDAAKHIETPTDASNIKSEFWPTVINGAKSYAETKGVDEPFFYGEILGDAGPNFGVNNYTTYMAITDNYTGDRALDKAYWDAAGELADSTYYKGASADKSVLWAESHDTYMGSSGSSAFSNTKDISNDKINKAWAIIASRADSTALFFARPNSVMGAASADTNWKSPVVAAVNKFKNHFNGTNEYLASKNSDVAYVERGTKGVVICKLTGDNNVSLTAHQMEDGTYTDQITGNTFTVSNGTISGTVGDTGVAVVYNTDESALNYIEESTLYLKPNSNWTQASARFAMYVYNSVTGARSWASMTSAGSGYYSADVPSGDWTNVIFVRMNPSSDENRWDAYDGEGHVWNQTNDLFPDDGTNCYTIASGAWSKGDGTWSSYSSQTTTAAPTTVAPTTVAPTTVQPTTAPPSSNTYTIYAINNAEWSNVYVYWWGSSTAGSWPGNEMTSYSGTKVYTYNIPNDATGLIFNIGSSKQTVDITSGINDGAVFTINSTQSNGKYTYSVAPDYYLVGTMNSWSNNNNYKFSISANSDGKLEYKLSGVQLAANAEFKVHSSSDSWYPSGSNHTVDAAGTYDIYFRPNGDGGSSWLSDSNSNKRYVYLANVTPYTVTWKNGNTTLDTDTVANGDTPEYTGDTPTKAETEQYTYTFDGWTTDGGTTVYASDNLPEVTGDVTYTAHFTENIKTFTVTWKNYDGTTLETDMNVPYGSAPSYDGDTPTRPNNGATIYTFSGWSPEITGETTVTGDTTYTAMFTAATQTYTITWKDGDGNTLKTETCIQGVTPQYTGDEPTKTATAQYSYTFNNTWDPPIAAASEDTTYTAQFDSTVNKYTITWKDGNGDTLKTEQVEYGLTPSYTGTTPTKDADANYYTFNNTWTPAIVSVTQNATYTAQFDATPIPSYTIYATNVIDWDDVYVYYWTYTGDNDWPGQKMTADEDNFIMSAEIPENAIGVIFTNGAQGNTAQTTNITTGIKEGARWAILNETDETETSKYKVHAVPSYYLVGSMTNWSTTNAATFAPFKNDSKVEEYKLSGVELSKNDQIKVYGDEVWYPDGYENQYDVTVNGTYDIYFRPNGDGGSKWHESYFYVDNVTQYTITWKDGDGNTLKTDTVTHGDTPAYTGDTPTKTATAQYTYSFNNTWSPSITAATADATYTAQFTETVNTYQITWMCDGTVLDTDEVAYGETPEYTGETPARTATAQYSYTFSGWTPEITAVTGPATYKAQFTETVNKYTITWMRDGTLLDTDEVAYGETPEFTGETPTRTATAQYSYTFSGWDPEITSVTGHATYTAQFTETVNKYTVTWKDGDGETLKTEEVAYGDTPAYSGTTPTKTATDQYTYTFNNTWSPEIVSVTQNATYTAQFTETVNKYTVTWKDGDGETLKTEEVAYGETPAYSGETPTKTATDQYTYTFNNTWSPEIVPVTNNATYTAQFTETVNKYTITWMCDGTVLDTDEVAYGETPEFTGETPTRTATAQYSYTFSGWDPEITSVTGRATYTAQFTETVNKYTVTWKDGDGETLKTEEVAYGDTPAYSGTTPTKTATDQYTYTFNNTWSPEIVAVTQDAVYTAQFDSTVNKYTITWIDGDGETLKAEEVAYGDTPAYSGETPTKTATDQYTYTFNNTWSPEIVPVTKNATYTAQFTETVNEYTIRFVNENGTELQSTQVAYGQTPVYNGAIPTKEATAQYTYAFDGWDSEITSVTGNKTYTATFSSEVNVYPVTWKNYNGDTIKTVYYEYGETPEFTDTAPTRQPTAEFSYEFTGWTPEIQTVTGDAEYTAVFSKTTNTYTVSWLDYNGDELETDEDVPYGTVPEYNGETPTRPADAQYTYAFTGWSPAIDVVTGNASYTAQYTMIINTYTVTWNNYNGTELSQRNWTYGSTPTYSGDTPTKPADDDYHYTFAGWTPAVTSVTGNATYTAQFDSVAHSYGGPDWTWSNDNTAATATFTCSCGHTEIIDADVELSFSEGKEIYTATVTFNNTEYSDSKTVDREDLVAGHSLTLGSDIGTNFFLNPTPEELEQGITVSFEWGDKTTEPITPAYDSAYGLYKITCDVAPAEMTYDISATIRIGDSETKVDVYSPLDYADYVLNNAEYIAWVTETYSEDYYNDLKDMCLAMLDYGARAQIRFERNAESDETLANGGTYTYDNSELTWESHASDMTANLENYGLTYVGSTVIYLYKTSLRHYYKITDPGLFAQYAGSITMDGSPIEYGERSGMIYFEVPEIAIYELDVQHTLTIGTNSYKYSATDYFAKLIETSQNEDAKELAKATYRYHLMAKEFFG